MKVPRCYQCDRRVGVVGSSCPRCGAPVQALIGPFGFRAFVDSAPVMERALASRGGLGWIGKHTNLINRDAGSWFFLGELYTDLPLPVDDAEESHCGTCRACIDVCPTGALTTRK